LIRTIGVVTIIVIAIVLTMVVTAPHYQTSNRPSAFRAPVIALELVGSAAEGKAILDQTSGGAAAITRAMYFDFGFIAGYALLYVLISVLLARRNGPLAKYLAWVAATSGLASAGFDVVENLGILRLINAAPITEEMARNIRDASLIKWTLGFVTIALLAVTFHALTKRAAWIGYAFTATAIVGLVALIFKPLLPLSFVPILFGQVWLIIVCLKWPADLMMDSR
jgi:hypothetical protein